MTEPPPTRDGWRAVALGFNELHTNGRLASVTDVTDRIGDLTERVAALLAAEEHLPTFHVRPEWKAKSYMLGGDAYVWTPVPRDEEHAVCQWRWVAIAANGRKLYGSTESYEHLGHAIDQAHEVADPMGAPVVIDAPTSRPPASPLENQ
jgi:hypothetical protein